MIKLNTRERLSGDLSLCLDKKLLALTQQSAKFSKKYEARNFKGAGSYGIVFKGRCLRTGKKVAIKYLQLKASKTSHLKKSLSEIQILKTLTSMPNNDLTTKLLDVFLPEGDAPINWAIIVMEYVRRDLRTILTQASMNKIKFTE